MEIPEKLGTMGKDGILECRIKNAGFVASCFRHRRRQAYGGRWSQVFTEYHLHFYNIHHTNFTTVP